MRGYPELSEPELRATLCRIAAEHQPDRAAMLTRIARHRPALPVADREPTGQALRLAGSALAVAVIIGVGGVARWALADGPDPGIVPVAPPATTSSTAVTTPASTSSVPAAPPTRTSSVPGAPPADTSSGPTVPPTATSSGPGATAPETVAPPAGAPATKRPRAAKSSAGPPPPPPAAADPGPGPAAPHPHAPEPLGADESTSPDTVGAATARSGSASR